MIKLQQHKTEGTLVSYYYVESKLIIFYKKHSLYRIWIDDSNYRDFNNLSSAIHYQLFIGTKLV